MRCIIGWSLALTIVVMGESVLAQPGGDGLGGRGGRGPGGAEGAGVGPRGERGNVGPRGEGPRGNRGPAGLARNLEPLFAWFDSNGDALLDRQEFGELSRFVQRQAPRPNGPPMGPGPAATPGPRPDGEPRVIPDSGQPARRSRRVGSSRPTRAWRIRKSWQGWRRTWRRRPTRWPAGGSSRPRGRTIANLDGQRHCRPLPKRTVAIE